MSDLVERARFLAAGQDDPHSVMITELCDEIDRLRKPLRSFTDHLDVEWAQHKESSW